MNHAENSAEHRAARRIVVIGGGISGLAAAHRALELNPNIQLTLVEASDRLGGVIRTTREQGYLLEHAADSFITNMPWAIQLCKRLGLEGELIETDRRSRKAMVVHRGNLHPVPEGFMLMAPSRMWPLLTSPLLSMRGKLRVLGETFVKARRDPDDESLASFARRRLGNEAFERLVQPLVGGIYTADAERLSMAAAMPRFVAMEKQHGSLIKALLRQRKTKSGAGEADSAGPRYSLFMTLRDGLGRLIDVLAGKLSPEQVRLNTLVSAIGRHGDAWQVRIAGREAPLECDAVIVATSAPVAARLLNPIDHLLAEELSSIEYAGTVIALAGYRREQIANPLDGFGCVVPEVEGRQVLSISYSSQKFAGRAPPGRVLLRVFLGGAKRPELLAAEESAIGGIVTQELGELLGARGQPELLRIVRWPATMPQYHVGHVERVARIEERVSQLPGLQLAGNAYHGVGLPQCVRGGEQAAERSLEPRESRVESPEPESS